MRNVSSKPELSHPTIESNSHLFDDWFDPIENMIRGQVRGLIEEMIRSELDATLSRPRYGRGAGHSEGRVTTAVVTGHRHGSRVRTLTGTFGKTEIAAMATVATTIFRVIRFPPFMKGSILTFIAYCLRCTATPEFASPCCLRLAPRRARGSGGCTDGHQRRPRPRRGDARSPEFLMGSVVRIGRGGWNEWAASAGAKGTVPARHVKLIRGAWRPESR